MDDSDPDDAVTKIISSLVVGAVVVAAVIAVVPKEVGITLGVITAVALLIGLTVRGYNNRDKRRAEYAAYAERDREARAREAKQRRISTLGEDYAALVEFALNAVMQIDGSEAARAGWLGDVDFSADIQEIAQQFGKAHALRKVSSELSALDKPSLDDCKIIEEAMTTIANLERPAIHRIELIDKCATEALLIDASLHAERVDARTAEQRAELQGKLSAMLYGVNTTSKTTPADSSANAVMARIMAYREIKNQIPRARGV
ncbi:hypothetical protein [Mycobacterium sp. SA01]|uniref:hypothetical protein n=1 Tax=Mycobacterium sp. SA01 TaxID=3238820 RepID=UPI00351B9CD0